MSKPLTDEQWGDLERRARAGAAADRLIELDAHEIDALTQEVRRLRAVVDAAEQVCSAAEIGLFDIGEDLVKNRGIFKDLRSALAALDQQKES